MAVSVVHVEGRRRSKRGRPVDISRHAISFSTALTLRASGIRVTTSRDGDFGRVLSIVLAEVFGNVPEDLFPLIKSASDQVPTMSDEEVRDELTWPYGPDR